MRRIFQSLAALTIALPLIAPAETLLVERIEAAHASGAERPARGMSMERVTARWGEPSSKSGPVGQPPITRWEYPGFVVIFEHRHVVHAVERPS
jgi:hypothetical protein